MKNCEHPGCYWPQFGGGYCKMHQNKRADFDRRSPLVKHFDKLKGADTLKSDDEFNLDRWFEIKMRTSKRVCENCGADLRHYNIIDWRGSQHHVFDKAIFHSVATHPANHGVLGRWCCHSQWHTSLENAQKMPFFKKAVERFLLFEPMIEERRRIPEVYLQYINPK